MATTIRVENVPADLLAALRSRAARQGVTVSDYVVALLRRDLGKPPLGEWLDELATRPPAASGLDIVVELHAARRERAQELDAAMRDRHR